MRLQYVADCMRDRGDGSSPGSAIEIMSVLQQLEFEATALHSACQQASEKGASGGDAMQWVREHRMTFTGMENGVRTAGHTFYNNAGDI